MAKFCISVCPAATLNYLYFLPGPPYTIDLKATVLNIEAFPSQHLAVADRATNHVWPVDLTISYPERNLLCTEQSLLRLA